MSPTSPEALYHAIPQAPVAANPLIPPADVEVDDVLELQENNHLPPANLAVETQIRWIHFVLGCVILLPWNVMITATPYFLARLSGSLYRTTFSSYLSTSFTASNFLFLAHATVTSKKAVPSHRIRLSTIWLLVMTFLLTSSTFYTLPPGLFFSFVLLNGIAQAAAGSYLQTATIQVASLFGPLTVQAMLTGQGAVAVVVSGVQVVSAIITTWGSTQESISTYVSDGSAEERSAFIFFSLSTLFLVFSLGVHAWLVSMPAYKSVAALLEHKGMGNGTAEEIQGLVSTGRHEFNDEKSHIMRVAKANITYEIAVAYVFIVTLAVYPPITASVQTTNPNTHPLLFSSVHFLMFNLGDFTGRYICSFRRVLIWDDKRLLVLSLARTLFIPLFLMCNVQSSTPKLSSSPIINSDFLFMTILLAFGVSNGYLSSLCMMSAPSLEHNPKLQGRREDVDVAATVASFCLVGGLAVGSIASFAVRAAVCGCNPFIA